MIPTDNYSVLPSGMREYIDTYGFHFSKKSCSYAVKMMRKVDVNTGKLKAVEVKGKDEIDKILEQYGMIPENDKGYDAVYLYHMAKADYPKTLPNDQMIASFVKETLDDPDVSEETTFRVWLAKMVGNGQPIMWEDII